MTTIAWDGKMIAVDSQVTEPTTGRRCSDIDKLHHVSDHIIAGAGCPFRIQQFLDWFEEQGESFERLPNPFADEKVDDFTAIVVDRQGKCWEYTSLLSPIEIKDKEAWGSGAGIAQGLMAAGKTAKQAIEIMCKQRLDVFTGGSVQWAQVKKRGKKNGKS